MLKTFLMVFMVVLEGSISLGYIDVNGNEVIAAIAEPIMWFGEISLIDQQPRSWCYCTQEKCCFYKFQHNHLKHFYCKIPITGITFALLTSQKLRYVFLELNCNSDQSINQRLAQRLLFILEALWQSLLYPRFSIFKFQDQLANMLTISRQTVNQELNLFETRNHPTWF